MLTGRGFVHGVVAPPARPRAPTHRGHVASVLCSCAPHGGGGIERGVLVAHRFSSRGSPCHPPRNATEVRHCLPPVTGRAAFSNGWGRVALARQRLRLKA